MKTIAVAVVLLVISFLVAHLCDIYDHYHDE
jgi:hypothetical protein